MIGLSGYILADTYFVAKGLGANGLASLNLAIPIYSFVHGSGLMLGMGGATKYTIMRGQGNEKQANRLFSQAVCRGDSVVQLSDKQNSEGNGQQKGAQVGQ